ncbi:uncharacterized protein METZ01_LOCUS231954 [marine metagenome]|uniref:GrpE protein homolog n=1 Tax=marine metagenome TaxID=408172 RepID=A0A382GVL7_9ZZZZ
MIKKEKKKDLDLKSNELKDEESCNDLLQEPEKGLNENELLAEIETLKDKLLRTQAEIQNVRKVASQEITRARLYGIDSLAREFLIVGDNILLALKTCEDDVEASAIKEGLELTLKSFEDSLQTVGVLPVDPYEDNFDPEKHEAISVIEDNKKKPNTVVDVVQRGFTIQERILRPAKVVVTKKVEKD